MAHHQIKYTQPIGWVYFLLLPDDLCFGLLFIAAVDDGDYCLGQIDEGEAGGGVAVEGHGRALVAIVADALNEGNLCQQGHVHLLGKALATFLTKDVILVLGKLGGGEPRHVLNLSQDGHVDLLVAIHIDTLTGIGKGYLLWGRHDDGSRDGERLQQRKMDIAGAWRGVEDEVI